jgi:hypothetical protein
VHGSGGTEIESGIINGGDGPVDLDINRKMISRHISILLPFIIIIFIFDTFKGLCKILISVVNWINLAHDWYQVLVNRIMTHWIP